MIDISRINNDPYYRYKMPRVVVKQEGKTGGIKTIIVNLEEIASSLKRIPLHILKFISYELATQSKQDGSKCVVNGKHDSQKIQDLIYDFIDTFVICPYCDNPETFYLDEDGLVMECLACGRKSRMKNHKLNSVILKDLGRNVSIRDESYFGSEVAGSSECDNSLRRLMESDGDKSEEIYNLLKDFGMSEEEIVIKLLSLNSDAFRKCRKIGKYVPSKIILSSFEGFIETNKKEGDIASYLKAFEEENIFKRIELFKYFTKPQSNRKRSPEFKKEVNEYFS